MASVGKRLRELFEREGVTIAPGAVDALSGRVFRNVGYEMIWAGGFMSSASQLGWADVNVIGLSEHASYVKNLALASGLPVLVDADNGYGNAVSAIRAVREMETAGAAGVVIEDQMFPKRCGLFPGLRPIVPEEEMEGKIRAATDARQDPDFVIVARTDALSSGLSVDDAVARARSYVAAGADAILPISKHFENLEAFGRNANLGKPMLIAPTLFPWVTTEQVGEIGFKIMVQPIVGALTMYRALAEAMAVLLREGTPNSLVERMWTFQELNDLVELNQITAWENEYLPDESSMATTV